MKHKTAELTGALLDAAVALALQMRPTYRRDGIPIHMTYSVPAWIDTGPSEDECGDAFEPSSRWAHGGPIIERERIGTSFEEATGLWHAELEHAARSDGQQRTFTSGPTALIAAMRAFVALKLGEEVELP